MKRAEVEELVRLYASKITDVIENYEAIMEESTSQIDKDYAPVEAFHEILDLLNVRR